MQVTFKCRFKSAASSANADSLCFHTWCITGTKGTRQHHVRGGPSSPFILWSPVFLLALASAHVIGVNPFIFGRNLGTIIPMYIYTISQQSRSECFVDHYDDRFSRSWSACRVINIEWSANQNIRNRAKSSISEFLSRLWADASCSASSSECGACTFPRCFLISKNNKAQHRDAYPINSLNNYIICSGLHYLWTLNLSKRLRPSAGGALWRQSN